MPALPGAPPAPAPAELSAAELSHLRTSVGALLRELASRTEPALHRALTTAQTAWDQADAVSILDEDLQFRAELLRERWRAVAQSGDPGAMAIALEALLAIDAAFGVVDLVERRLATLIRLRVNGGGELLPDGRPFLDVGAALGEAARGWA